MKSGKVEIVLVLDRSGSMQSTKADAEGGLRSFVAGQRMVDGECALTFYRFDNVIERVFEEKPLSSVQDSELALEPRGSTALLDAMGRAIDEVGKRLSALHEDERPEKVFFVTITDGYENASQQFTKHQIFEKITLQRDTYKWEFTFIGANQDAIATAASIGIPAAASLTFTGKNTKRAYEVVNMCVTRSREGGQSFSYTGDERKSTVS